MKNRILWLAAAVMIWAGMARATVYYVAISGNDAADGLTPATAFRSVQRGVDALDVGDGLEIGPGEYFGAVSRANLGGPEADTVIRASIPGTVLLRGDVPAPEFRPAPDYRFVYVADFDVRVQAVNELDTLAILEAVPNVNELEFLPGGFFQDADAGRLYISTSDLQPPDRHVYTLSVVEGSGIYLVNPERVVIEGLAACGYHNAEVLPRLRGGNGSGDNIRHGFYLWRARRSTIRDCRAFFNGGGITILTSREGGGNLIDGCTAWANHSKHGISVGNIVILSVEDDAVRNSHAFRGERHGIRMYGGGENPAALLADNLSWGNRGADFQVKGGSMAAPGGHRVVRCLAPMKGITAAVVSNSLVRTRDDGPGNNIVLSLEEDMDPDHEFADPENFDYRLQAGSRFREAGASGADRGPFPYRNNIFYLSPAGDDAADGLSLAGAWRTLARAVRDLAPGDTLYLEAGRYTAPATLAVQGVDGVPVSLRGRGRSDVIIEGDMTVSGGSFEFVRLFFSGALQLDGLARASFMNCRWRTAGPALTVRRTAALRLMHSEFMEFGQCAVDLSDGADVFMQGNIFNNRAGPALLADSAASVQYSDYNVYAREPAWRIADDDLELAALHGLGHENHARQLVPEYADGPAPALRNAAAFVGCGPYLRPAGLYHPRDDAADTLRLAGPFVHAVTDTTADIEWWSSGPTDVRVAWGAGDMPVTHTLVEAHRYGSFSLTGLQPDTGYVLHLTLDRPLRMPHDASVELAAEDTVAIRFRTAAAADAPRTYYVAMDGDDQSDGLSRARAWRTVSRAASMARPGDSVMVAGGAYSEIVRVRSTGDAGRPVTFRNIPGERVVFNGAGRILDCAFYLTDKSYVHIDGFYFVDFMQGSRNMPWSDRASGDNAAIVVYRGGDVRITRCFHDSRGPGYGPGLLHARHSRNLLVQNNAVIGSMGGGISFAGCPDLRISNNVFVRNLISHVSEAVNEPHQKFVMENNIFTDSIASKVTGSLFAIGKLESLVERNNCYYLRIPVEERKMFMFYEPDPAYSRAALAYRLAVEFDAPPMIAERARMTLCEYQQQFNPASGSVALDPLLAGTLEWTPRVDEDGRPVYFGDRLSGRPDLDFPHLFTTHPELIERGIGLQPAVFDR